MPVKNPSAQRVYNFRSVADEGESAGPQFARGRLRGKVCPRVRLRAGDWGKSYPR
jgi:hypothetical protein